VRGLGVHEGVTGIDSTIPDSARGEYGGNNSTGLGSDAKTNYWYKLGLSRTALYTSVFSCGPCGGVGRTPACYPRIPSPVRYGTVRYRSARTMGFALRALFVIAPGGYSNHFSNQWHGRTRNRTRTRTRTRDGGVVMDYR